MNFTETPLLWVQDASRQCVLDMFVSKAGIVTVIWRGMPHPARDQSGLRAILNRLEHNWPAHWLHDVRALTGSWESSIPFILNEYVPACRRLQPVSYYAFVVGNNTYSQECVDRLIRLAEQSPTFQMGMFETRPEAQAWLMSRDSAPANWSHRLLAQSA